jgi:hypothetical protein
MTRAQLISMKVAGLDYKPNQFTVKQGTAVQWWIDASSRIFSLKLSFCADRASLLRPDDGLDRAGESPPSRRRGTPPRRAKPYGW